MRTTAANVAARAAFGGDDMLSKWQLMAEQARQKREGRMNSASGSQSGNDAVRKFSSAAGRRRKDNQEGEKRSHLKVTCLYSPLCHPSNPKKKKKKKKGPQLSHGTTWKLLLDEHYSPQWYDIVHFEHKLSWRPHTNEEIFDYKPMIIP